VPSSFQPATRSATTLVRTQRELASARDVVDRVAGLKLEGTLPRLTVSLLRAEVADDRTAAAKIRTEARALGLRIQ